MTRRHVLTAAHCLAPLSDRKVRGEIFFKKYHISHFLQFSVPKLSFLVHFLQIIRPRKARRRLSVRLGKHDRRRELEPGEVARRVVRLNKHPGFRPAPHFWNDIAVLTLESDVPFRCG